MMRLTLIILIALWLKPSSLFTQDIDPFVTNSFRSYQVISIPTVKIPDRYALNLNIQHKFGMTNLQNGWFKDFFGTDLTADIRFGFYYRLSPHLMVGVGRTKFNKTYDFEAKYLFLRQRKDNSIPLSAALYANVAARTADFPPETNLFFPDSTTAFAYKPLHRYTYLYQLLLDRKINNWLSVEAAPLWIYRNLTVQDEPHVLFALPLAARIKIGLFSSLLLEYTPVLSSLPSVRAPVALAYEIATAGHSFQIIVSNSPHILPHHSGFSKENTDPFTGKFYIGFNIHRRFWLKKTIAPSS